MTADVLVVPKPEHEQCPNCAPRRTKGMVWELDCLRYDAARGVLAFWKCDHCDILTVAVLATNSQLARAT